jgi:hypothetical protein
MIKFPSVDRIGQRSNDGIFESDDKHLHVQEKLDGANFRFTLDDNLDLEYQEDNRVIAFGSRNVFWKNESDVASTFKHAVEYVRREVDIRSLKCIEREHGPLTYFGEAMHSHTIDYDWDSTPSFIGFAIYSEDLGEFLSPSFAEQFYSQLGLPTPNRHPIDVVKDGFDCPQSEFYDGPAEGVVIWNTETEQIAKVRGTEFKEAHGTQSAVNDDSYEPSDAKNLANSFATEMRILKMIHKYRDRGREIKMEIMKDLWQDVFEDIIQEEYETIFLNNYEINTKEFRSEVAGNTATVLEQYLNRPDDSVLNKVQ